jgi:hypothetical protein
MLELRTGFKYGVGTILLLCRRRCWAELRTPHDAVKFLLRLLDLRGVKSTPGTVRPH